MNKQENLSLCESVTVPVHLT